MVSQRNADEVPGNDLPDIVDVVREMGRVPEQLADAAQAPSPPLPVDQKADRPCLLKHQTVSGVGDPFARFGCRGGMSRHPWSPCVEQKMQGGSMLYLRDVNASCSEPIVCR